MTDPGSADAECGSQQDKQTSEEAAAQTSVITSTGARLLPVTNATAVTAPLVANDSASNSTKTTSAAVSSTFEVDSTPYRINNFDIHSHGLHAFGAFDFNQHVAIATPAEYMPAFAATDPMGYPCVMGAPVFPQFPTQAGSTYYLSSSPSYPPANYIHAPPYQIPGQIAYSSMFMPGSMYRAPLDAASNPTTSGGAFGDAAASGSSFSSSSVTTDIRHASSGNRRNRHEECDATVTNGWSAKSAGLPQRRRRQKRDAISFTEPAVNAAANESWQIGSFPMPFRSEGRPLKVGAPNAAGHDMATSTDKKLLSLGQPSTGARRVRIVREIEAQTDFPSHVAHLSLEEEPNSLYQCENGRLLTCNERLSEVEFRQMQQQQHQKNRHTDSKAMALTCNTFTDTKSKVAPCNTKRSVGSSFCAGQREPLGTIDSELGIDSDSGYFSPLLQLIKSTAPNVSQRRSPTNATMGKTEVNQRPVVNSSGGGGLRAPTNAPSSSKSKSPFTENNFPPLSAASNPPQVAARSSLFEGLSAFDENALADNSHSSKCSVQYSDACKRPLSEVGSRGQTKDRRPNDFRPQQSAANHLRDKGAASGSVKGNTAASFARPGAAASLDYKSAQLPKAHSNVQRGVRFNAFTKQLAHGHRAELQLDISKLLLDKSEADIQPKVPVATQSSVLPTKTTPVNQLDSSAPLVKIGKVRTSTKARRPSTLKKVILQERENRRKARQQAAAEVALCKLPNSVDTVMHPGCLSQEPSAGYGCGYQSEPEFYVASSKMRLAASSCVSAQHADSVSKGWSSDTGSPALDSNLELELQHVAAKDQAEAAAYYGHQADRRHHYDGTGGAPTLHERREPHGPHRRHDQHECDADCDDSVAAATDSDSDTDAAGSGGSGSCSSDQSSVVSQPPAALSFGCAARNRADVAPGSTVASTVRMCTSVGQPHLVDTNVGPPATSLSSPPAIAQCAATSSSQTCVVDPPLADAEATVEHLLLERLHSNRFREYCYQILDEALDKLAAEVVDSLSTLQYNAHQRNPIKSRTKRRLVCGLREIVKYLKLGRIRCVLIAPNIERIRSKGGLDDVLTTILSLAAEKAIPCVFALSRRQLGHACHKMTTVSAVGVLNYQGCDAKYKQMQILAADLRQQYAVMRERVKKEIEQKLAEKAAANAASNTTGLIGSESSSTDQQESAIPSSLSNVCWDVVASDAKVEVDKDESAAQVKPDMVGTSTCTRKPNIDLTASYHMSQPFYPSNLLPYMTGAAGDGAMTVFEQTAPLAASWAYYGGFRDVRAPAHVTYHSTYPSGAVYQPLSVFTTSTAWRPPPAHVVRPVRFASSAKVPSEPWWMQVSKHHPVPADAPSAALIAPATDAIDSHASASSTPEVRCIVNACEPQWDRASSESSSEQAHCVSNMNAAAKNTPPSDEIRVINPAAIVAAKPCRLAADLTDEDAGSGENSLNEASLKA